MNFFCRDFVSLASHFNLIPFDEIHHLQFFPEIQVRIKIIDAKCKKLVKNKIHEATVKKNFLSHQQNFEEF